jgi:tetratricopeptide (TPR) repeat protein
MEIRNEVIFRSNLLILVTLIASILITVPAFAIEWNKAYERGRDKIRSGDCAQGRPLMLEALRGNPKADPRTPTYGTMVIEYFPQYYLAVCAVEAGKIQEAQRYLKEAEGSRIGSSKLAKDFDSLKAQVTKLVQQQQPVPKPGETKPPVQEPIKEQKPPPPVIEKKPDPPVQDATRDNQIAIQSALREANRALLDGQYEDARAAASRVLRLDPDNREARNVLSQITGKQAEEQLAREKQKKFKEVEQAIRRKDFDTAENLALALKEQYPSDARLSSLFQEIENNRNAVVQDQKDQELRKNAEREVLVAYYRGEYDQVIQLVSQNLSKGQKSWRLHFFLGCSYAALSMLEESGTETRLKLARESFRRARSISSAAPLPPYISPKILEIWRSS